MKQYTIIGGMNGVGKSSLSGVLRHQLPDMGLIIDPNVIVSKESCDRLTAGKLALARVENCLQKGINFSQETTLSGRRTIRFADLAEVLPYCDEVHFYDNENGFREVALYQSGEIMPLVTSPPQWLRDFMAWKDNEQA